MDDNSLMSFGAHKGKPLQEVPASYWIWLEDQEWFSEKYPALYKYFQDNMEAIEQEYDEDESWVESYEN